MSEQSLDAIIDQMICKEYLSGDVLWRTSAQLDFFGVIQIGEIMLEHRLNGSVIGSVKLTAGNYVLLPDLKNAKKRSFVLARAVTDVRLYVLRSNQFGTLRAKLPVPNDGLYLSPERFRFIPLRRLWIISVVLLAMLLVWNDGIRIISGFLYTAAKPESQTNSEYQKSLHLLNYVETLDQNAVFAYNQEGYIWFQQNDMQRAEAAFVSAINIDQNDSPTLNNMATIYFLTGRVPQSAVFLQKAMQKNPNSAIVRYNFGMALLQQGYNIDALREFKEANYINPTWALPYLQQGFIYIKMQDYANAEQAARTTIQIDDTQQSAHLILAIALFNQHKNREALKYVESALQVTPDDGVAKFYKALILKDLMEYDAAFLILQELLVSENDPLQKSRITTEIESLQYYFPVIRRKEEKQFLHNR